MNHIYDKFVIALDHSTNKITIYIHLKKEKTTNKMKVPRRKQKFIAKNYVKVLLPKKITQREMIISRAVNELKVIENVHEFSSELKKKKPKKKFIELCRKIEANSIQLLRHLDCKKLYYSRFVFFFISNA